MSETLSSILQTPAQPELPAPRAEAAGGAPQTIDSSGAAPAIETHPAWPMLSTLPVHLRVAIPLRRLRVRDLLALTVGQVVESAWPTAEDLPVRVGAVQLSWAEFEVVEQRTALRLTRMA